MVATNLKAETLALIDRRAALAAEMDAIIATLAAPGGPGITGGLVDFEGFPIQGIDIPAVRSQRRRLSELRNDYNDITAKVDQNMQLLHSAKLANTSQSSKLSASSVDATTRESAMDVDLPSMDVELPTMDVDLPVKIPFALVDEITDASPAAEDGLQLGDQIIKFGNVEYGDGVLSRLASEVQANEGYQLPLVVMRQGSLMNISITPRQWHGRGLLGCHFRTL